MNTIYLSCPTTDLLSYEDYVRSILETQTAVIPPAAPTIECVVESTIPAPPSFEDVVS